MVMFSDANDRSWKWKYMDNLEPLLKFPTREQNPKLSDFSASTFLHNFASRDFSTDMAAAYLADELIPQQNAGKSDSELSNCIVLKRQSNHNLPSFNELAIYQSHGCHTDDLMSEKKTFSQSKETFPS